MRVIVINNLAEIVDVFDDVRSGYQLRDGQSLLIDSARARDAGIYVCMAQNNAGTTLRQIILEVQGVQTLLFVSEHLLPYRFVIVFVLFQTYIQL